MRSPHALIDVIAVFFLLFPFTARSESSPDTMNATPSLDTLKKKIELATLDRVQYELAYAYDDKEYASVKAEKIPAMLDLWLSSPADRTNDGKTVPQDIYKRDFVTRNRAALEQLFLGLKLVGNELGRFLVGKSSDNIASSIPLQLGSWNESTALLVTGIAYAQTFNTLRTTSKQRAASVVESIIIPSLDAFAGANLPDEVAYIGMCVVYGSQDFSDDSIALNFYPEMVAFVVPYSACRSFVEAKIAQEVLLEQSVVFLTDRDMRVAQIKRVVIAID